MRTVNLDVHVPANRTEIADRFFTGLTSFMVANNIFRGQKIMPDGSFLNVTHYTWDDLILPEDQKRTIKHNVVDIIEKQALYERNGIAMKRGIMFYGCPGTGKTLTGKVLASQLNGVTFIWVTPNQVREPADVTRIYALARELAPTIVFIEDIDLIARDRSLNGENPILCELLNQLDGVLENRGVVTVVTTNYPEVVEGALQDRPGRFDRSVEFKNPDFETARLMLVAMLDGRILDADQEPVDVEAIAKMCDGLSPSHIREVVNTAVMFAIDSGSLTANDLAIVRQSHLVAACEEVLANKNRRKAPVQQEVNAVSSDDKDIVCRSYETVSSVPVAISPSLQATVALSSC
jgi:cell division protease FtsH